ncbi:hypothetical protein CHH55_08275 [Niallia circulans]|uniref:hypothetical protein n=1 Tax=Niallia circulans TaxID=1397 RepID=UPI000BA5DCB9|nr:hypothetical protein [Niallia circulans]PAD88276.1 hypothetical protein CHH55_08275 [Niallia circulans]
MKFVKKISFFLLAFSLLIPAFSTVSAATIESPKQYKITGKTTRIHTGKWSDSAGKGTINIHHNFNASKKLTSMNIHSYVDKGEPYFWNIYVSDGNKKQIYYGSYKNSKRLLKENSTITWNTNFSKPNNTLVSVFSNFASAGGKSGNRYDFYTIFKY